MLMTPIKPKVTASPSAASSRTLPRLIPLNTNPALSARRNDASTPRTARSSAVRTAGSLSTASRSASSLLVIAPGTRSSCAMAARRRLLSGAESASIPWVVRSASRTRGSDSRWSAASTAGSRSVSGACSSARAASRRRSGSGADISRPRRARCSDRRRRLLMVTFSRSSVGGTDAPESASLNAPSRSIRTAPSGAAWSLPSRSARKTLAEPGSPVATSAASASSRSGWLPRAILSRTPASSASATVKAARTLTVTPAAPALAFRPLLVPGDEGAPRLCADRGARLPHHVELPVRLHLADVDRLPEVVVRLVHLQREPRRRGEGLSGHCLAHVVDLRAAGFLHGLRPHVHADVGRLHRIVGDARVAAGELVLLHVRLPHLDERGVVLVLERHEVVPGGEMANQRLGVDAAQLLFAHGERDYRDVRRLQALVSQLLVEGHVGVAVDGGDHRGVAAGPERFDLRDDGLVVVVTEGRVRLRDVRFGDALHLEERPQDLVGGARIDVVGAEQEEALGPAAFLGHQILDRRDRLLVRRRARVEDVLRKLLALVLHRVVEEPVELLEDRQHRLAGHRGPAAEHCGHLVLGQELPRLLGEEGPVRGRIDDHRLQLLPQHATLGVDLLDGHQGHVLERRLADRHRSGQRVKDTDLDRVCRARGERAGEDGAEQGEPEGSGLADFGHDGVSPRPG